MTFQNALNLFGGVALLIYGIKIMGDSLQEVAGDNLRKLLASLTGTPLKGVAAGALVTMIIQSSGATTVMVVSFVHVGLMNLAQGFSVVMGANIGTTITAQLIAFDIRKYSIIAAIVGVLFTIMGRNARHKEIGTGLMGFSLLFVGMGMMHQAMSFLAGRQELFAYVNNTPIMGLFVGAFVTMVVPASAATVGLTIAMASQGLLDIKAAIAIILGDNIGTTITAVLASLGGNRSAKQAAAAHVLFNLIGATIMMILIDPFSRLIGLTSSEVARQVANSHSAFNIINTLLFLPFIGPYTAFIKKLLPDEPKAAVPTSPKAQTKYLDYHLIEVSPAASVDAVKKEMVALGWTTYSMVENCRKIIVENDTDLMQKVIDTEKTVNEINRAIVEYSMRVGQRTLAPGLSKMLNSLTSGTSDIERIGDHCENLVELIQFLIDREQHFSPKALNECEEIFEMVETAVRTSITSVEKEDFKMAGDVDQLEDRIDQMEKLLRARHIERLNSGKCQPNAGIAFIDILSNLERIGDHAHNLSLIVSDISSAHNRQGK